MPLLRAASDDLFALVGEASRHFGLPLDFVEKDFWIVELLRSVSRPVKNTIPIFKGGTSLSKTFGLIERFSEDVDILLEITSTNGAALGKGSVDRILKHICGRAGTDLGVPPDRQVLKGSTTGVHRNVRYLYPVRANAQTTEEGILLEMGRRGVQSPRERRKLYSHASQYALTQARASESDYEEFTPVEIDVLNPELSLVEKLALVHDLSSRYPKTAEQLMRSGRHFYDIYRLLSDAGMRSLLLSHSGLVARMASEIDENSKRWEFSYTPRPEAGYATSPAFDGSHPCHEIIRSAYNAIASLVYGKRPSLDECLAVVHESAETL